jgi:hypothetical protein
VRIDNMVVSTGSVVQIGDGNTANTTFNFDGRIGEVSLDEACWLDGCPDSLVHEDQPDPIVVPVAAPAAPTSYGNGLVLAEIKGDADQQQQVGLHVLPWHSASVRLGVSHQCRLCLVCAVLHCQMREVRSWVEGELQKILAEGECDGSSSRDNPDTMQGQPVQDIADLTLMVYAL